MATGDDAALATSLLDLLQRTAGKDRIVELGILDVP
jgi:hypothetical protein